MKIQIYAKDISEPLELLQREIKKIIPRSDMRKFNNVNALRTQLKNNTRTENYEAITILLVNHRNELKELQQITYLLTETRIILILPDKDSDTIKLGHKLLPRYLDFIDSNFNDVGEVIQKLTKISLRETGNEHDN